MCSESFKSFKLPQIFSRSINFKLAFQVSVKFSTILLLCRDRWMLAQTNWDSLTKKKYTKNCNGEQNKTLQQIVSSFGSLFRHLSVIHLTMFLCFDHWWLWLFRVYNIRETVKHSGTIQRMQPANPHLPHIWLTAVLSIKWSEDDGLQVAFEHDTDYPK